MNAQLNKAGVTLSILLLAGAGCGSDDPKKIPQVSIDASLDEIETGDAGAGGEPEPEEDSGGGSELSSEECFTGTPSRMEDFLNACSDVATAEKEPVIPLAKDGVVTKIPNAL